MCSISPRNCSPWSGSQRFPLPRNVESTHAVIDYVAHEPIPADYRKEACENSMHVTKNESHNAFTNAKLMPPVMCGTRTFPARQSANTVAARGNGASGVMGVFGAASVILLFRRVLNSVRETPCRRRQKKSRSGNVL